MNIVLGSAFRNSAAGVPHYMMQAALLKRALGEDRLRVVAVEGDSTDGTRDALARQARACCLDLDLITCNHGGPDFGSVESAERMTALSKVGNAIFDGVRAFDDVLIYVESDLMWLPGTMLQLIRNALGQRDCFDIFSPLVMAGEVFYDIWGFRGLDGRRFSPFYPFFPGLNGGPFEVGSAGSCLVMRGTVARECRIEDDNCLVGWCRDARSKGYRIAVCPDLTVRQA